MASGLESFPSGSESYNSIATMLHVYAAPAWWGFAGEGNSQRLECLITRMRRSGYLPTDFPDFASLAEDADHNLFNSIRRNKIHVLPHYFVERSISTHLLRLRAHNFVLPLRDNRNFVSRASCLSKYGQAHCIANWTP